MMNHKQHPSTSLRICLLMILCAGFCLALPGGWQAGSWRAQAFFQQETPTATNTREVGFSSRPLVVVQSYSPSEEKISPGQNFTIKVQFTNKGQLAATNMVATFTPGELTPRDTGGVIAVGKIEPGGKKSVTQPLTATWDVYGKLNASITMSISYTDMAGNSYTETFVLTVPIYTAAGPAKTSTPTVTPTSPNTQRPQLVIISYATDIPQLQPGAQFAVQMNIQNMGTIEAKRVTMIVGGGSTTGGSVNGTPDTSGGTSGGTGDFTNFAPLGSSNVQTLEDLSPSESIAAKQSLIVNVSTNPGAYPMKVSFTYSDEKGIRYTDDQVITLLVYSPPQVDVSFYSVLPEVYAGQPTNLPLQVNNLGRKIAILGNMTVSTEGGQLSNNVALVGTLEPGGYFPLDAMLVPNAPGPLALKVIIEYTDDFNQSQKIEKIIPIEVLETPGGVPGGEGQNGTPGVVAPGGKPGTDGSGEIPVGIQETFWQKAWRFVLGLIGLSSGQNSSGGGEIISPVDGVPVDGGKPVVPPIKGP
jgi:hypothetical protein